MLERILFRSYCIGGGRPLSVVNSKLGIRRNKRAAAVAYVMLVFGYTSSDCPAVAYVISVFGNTSSDCLP
jgi:hypothetical protein